MASSSPAGTPSPTTAPSTGPITLRVDLVGLTAISPSQWWVVEEVPCSGGLCRTLFATTDSGIHFTPIPMPGAVHVGLGPPGPDEVQTVRFADQLDGWAFGPSLYSTHSGGHTWGRLDLGGTVYHLVAGSDAVFAIVSPPMCTGDVTRCPSPRLWRSPVGRDDWHRIEAIAGASPGLAVHGRSVWVVSANGAALGDRLQHSTDDGDHFATLPGQITGIACDYSPSDAQTIWAYCSGGPFMFFSRSTDAGEHFAAPGQGATPNGCPNGSGLAAASRLIAVAACDFEGDPLLRTWDGGSTWSVAHPALSAKGRWTVLGFTTPEVGYAFWGDQAGTTLWRTADAGATWTMIQTPS